MKWMNKWVVAGVLVAEILAAVGAWAEPGARVTVGGHGGVQLWEGGPYWAETNIGAEEPWEYGLYFWWGDTVRYRRVGSAWVASDGAADSFSFSSENTPTYGKTTATLQSEGWTDASGNLAPEHDAAQAHWGGGWRMPTDAEFAELISNTTTIWTNLNGVYGRLVTGKGDYAAASIFLPAAGCGDGTSLDYSGSYGFYWSAAPHSSDSDGAWVLYFYSGYFRRSYGSRYYGRSVRALRGFAEEPPPAGEVTWKYSVSNGAATVTGVEPAVGDLVMPAELGGCPVREIGAGAFADCGGMTALAIPDTVTNIGKYAFSMCSGLREMVIPEGVTSIGYGAFQACRGLSAVSIPASVESIGWGAFRCCDALEDLVVAEANARYSAKDGVLYSKDGKVLVCCPNRSGAFTVPYGVEEIGEVAFDDCGLTAVALPDSLRNIGECAFEGCMKLAAVTIPNGVTNIGGGAFINCGLKAAIIGDHVATIGESAFSGCAELAEVVVPASVTSLGVQSLAGCSGLKTLHVPAAWEGTGMLDGAWGGEGKPDGCTVVYEGVPGGNVSWRFNRMWNGEVTILGAEPAEGVLVIPSELFGGRVTSIEDGSGNGAFSGCSRLTAVSIPTGVERIGWHSFSECSGLTAVTIPDGVASIGEGAFSGCGALAAVSIPDSVVTIWNEAFNGCAEALFETNAMPGMRLVDGWIVGCEASLSGAVALTSIRGIAAWVFRECSRPIEVTLPLGLTNIGEGWFGECSGLVSVAIPRSVTTIGNSAFAGCSGLTSLDLPDSVRRIENFAFESCDGLVSVVIPNGVEYIGNGAFGFCDGLRSISLPASLQELGWGGPFEGCKSLLEVTVAEGNEHYASKDGVVYSKDGRTLVCCPGGRTGTFTILDGVECIWDFAFHGCEKLTSVEIPASVRSIEGYAFSHCTGLTELAIPFGVTNIGYYAFNHCTGLTSVTIPDSVMSIVAGAFSECTGLTELTIPDSVTEIGGYVFEECTGLTALTIPDSVTEIGWNAFADCSGLKTLSMPGSWEGKTYDEYGQSMSWTERAAVPGGCTVVYRAAVQAQVVTYHGNGGSPATQVRTNTVGEAYGAMPTATWAGHGVFAGWWTAATGGEKVTSNSVVTAAAERELWAHWTTEQVTTFKGNGGTPATQKTTNTIGAAYGTLPDVERDGWTFTGWWTKTNGGARVSATNTVTTASARTLYAQWTEIPKTLALELASGSVREDAGSVRCVVRRTGPLAAALAVSAASSRAGDVSVPATVTIPAGARSGSFLATVVDNAAVDGTRTAVLSVSASGYEGASAELAVLDDEVPGLALWPETATLREGESAEFTVRRELAGTEPLSVSLSGIPASQGTHPLTVTIPAGETSAVFVLEAADDAVAETDAAYTLRAGAQGHTAATAEVTFADDDVPGVLLTLAPVEISEGSGPNAVYATLERTDRDRLDEAVTVALRAEPSGQLVQLPASVTIPARTMGVAFRFGAVDNGVVDGERTVRITGAIRIASCGCDGTPSGGGAIEAMLLVHDDDGPALSLAAEPATMQEGLAEAGRLTVSHNVAGWGEAVTVALAHDGPGEIELPANVTIPAGERSASVAIRTLDDGVADGAKTVAIYANAVYGAGDGTPEGERFAPGSAWVMVTDQNLPDLAVGDVLAEGATVAGGDVELSFSIANKGFMGTPGRIGWAAYLTGSADASSMSEETRIAQGTVEGGLAAGATRTVRVPVTLPEEAGARWIGVRADPEGEIAELDESDNAGWSAGLTVSPSYTAVAAAERATYLEGEEVRIAGRATLADGKTPAARVPVDVWISMGGAIRSWRTATDGQGNFVQVFESRAGESGHYGTGAEYPDLGAHAEQAAFDILGLERVSRAAITNEVELGQSSVVAVLVRNRSGAALTGLEATAELESGTFRFAAAMPGELGGGETGRLELAMEAVGATDGTDWERATVRIASAEGCVLEFPVYVHSAPPGAVLEARPAKLEANMVPGTPRWVEVGVANTGGGDSGKVGLSIPSGYSGWMRVVGAAELDNLAAGETAAWTVELNAREDMDLNAPWSGAFAVNAEHGGGILVPFTFTPVAETAGRMRVRAVDEYTAAGGSGVGGATVAVVNPYTGAVVASGTADGDGWWESDGLPAGVYHVKVAADRHDGGTKRVEVGPGETAEVACFVSFNAVEYTFTMERTSVEDEYEVKLIADYVTQVPAPVLVVTAPDELPILPPGGSYLFNVIVENKGLIAARDPKFTFPDVGYEFEELSHFDEIPASSLVVVPVRMSNPAATASGVEGRMRRAAAAAAAEARGALGGGMHGDFPNVDPELAQAFSKMFPCTTGIMVEAWFLCYKDGVLKAWRSGNIRWFGALCDLLSHLFNGLNFGGGGGGEEGETVPSRKEEEQTKPGEKPPRSETGVADCDEIITWINNALGFVPGIKGMPTQAILDMTLPEKTWDERIMSWLDWMGEKGLEVYGKWLLRMQDGAQTWKSALGYWLSGDWVPMEAKDFSPSMQEMLDGMHDLWDAMNAVFGWSAPRAAPDGLRADLERKGLGLVDLSTDAWMTDTSKAGVERRNLQMLANAAETLRVAAALGTALCAGDEVTDEDLATARATILELEREAQALGYADTDEACQQARAFLAGYVEQRRDSVCAKITLELSQKATVAREAFEGTLTVRNGNEENAMTGISFQPLVYDAAGGTCNGLFGIQQKEVRGFSGADITAGGLGLGAGAAGTAVIRYVPTPDAAPEAPATYSFGGILRYVNPYNGNETEVTLLPVALQVNPCPRLELHYFLQRDVYGDNPLTTDIVEPSEPAELALLVVNKGAGTARNFRVETAEPEIVDNEKGLLVDFRYTGARVNGKDASVAGTDVRLGDIGPRSTAQARWNLECSLLGHFTRFEANFTQVNDWGNPATCLIDAAETHILVHAVTAGGGADDDFLGVEGGDGMTPNRIWLADGTAESVAGGKASVAWAPGTGHGCATVTVDTAESGPFHASVADPAFSGLRAVRVARQDSSVLDGRNAWTTRWRLPNGSDPVEEPAFHLFDVVASHGRHVYTVEFEGATGTVPEIVSFGGIAEGALLESAPDAVEVTFSCPVAPSSFGSGALVFTCQGVRFGDLSGLTVQPVEGGGNRTFRIAGLGSYQTQIGRYVLVVQASKVASEDGTAGADGRSVSWGYTGAGGLADLTLSGVALSPCGETEDGVLHLAEAAVSIGGAGTAAGLAVTATARLADGTEVPLGSTETGEDLRFSLAVRLPESGGAMALLLDCEDRLGNARRTVLSVFLDVQEVQAAFEGMPLPEELADGIRLVFQSGVKALTVTASMLALERDGMPVGLDGVSLEALSDREFAVAGLEELAAERGEYRLRADLSGVEKRLSGKRGRGAVSAAWTRIPPDTAPAELWLDVGRGNVVVGADGVEEGFGMDGTSVSGPAKRYVLTGTSAVHGVRFAGGSFTSTWTNLAIGLGAKDAVAVALEGASVAVALAGDNAVASGEDCAGVRVDAASALVLEGTGRLVARGGAYGAGIGGGLHQESGRIEVREGTVEAYGGEYGAGIGGGLVAPAAGAVVIAGGSVKARGSDGGEDIGGGFGRAGSGVPVGAAGTPVREVEVPLATDMLPVEAEIDLGSGRTYRYRGMGHEGDPSLWFWLPDGTYEFAADGDDYGVHVAGEGTEAVFTDPGNEHFENPVLGKVGVGADGAVRAGMNPAYRLSPFEVWSATGLEGADWNWRLLPPAAYTYDATNAVIRIPGGTDRMRVLRVRFLPR